MTQVDKTTDYINAVFVNVSIFPIRSIVRIIFVYSLIGKHPVISLHNIHSLILALISGDLSTIIMYQLLCYWNQ
jgi:hypothetical protein